MPDLTDFEQFRSSRSGRQFADNTVNRNRQGQVDHDVFEGLPVRRWARQPYTFSQDPKLDVPDSSADDGGSNQYFPELPMPKDSHLLSPMSRALLRAARAGCIYLRHVNSETEEDDKETTEAGETAPATRVERSFTARKWTAVPKHMEPPEVEFLAKRRPGLPSLYGASGTLNANNRPPMRKTKIKKVDPTTGEVSVYEVWVPEGHTVEGEIKDDAEASPEQKEATATTETPAPGTTAEVVGVTNADGAVAASEDANTVESPSKRRGPPPPKRKGKGAGKGRRKRVMFAPGEGADAAMVHGADGAGDERMPVDGEQFEEEEEEEGEEGEEGMKEEDAALEAKSPSIALPDSGTTSVTEQAAAPVEPSAENQPSTSDQQPPVTALPPEKPSLEAAPAPSQEIPVPNGTDVVSTSVQNAADTESQQSLQELQQSKPPSPPGSAAPPTLEPSPVVGTTTNDEVPGSAPDNVQISQNAEPVAEPAPDAMEGVEQTHTTENLTVPEQAPALEKADVPGVVEQTTTTGNQEAVETAGEVLSQAPAPITTAEVASAPVVSEAISQPVPGVSAEGNVDLLGTLEASLGEEKVKVSPEQGGTTGSASAEQNLPQTTAVLPAPESASATAPAAPPAPAPAVSEEVKAEPAQTSEPQLQPQPGPGPVPEPVTKEGAVAEEKKEEPEA